MNSKYYEVTSELDAREILRYLNHLGIHNISGEVLKYFISDLKKLIKYDLEQRKENSSQRNFEHQGPERLHSATTFSSRTRSKTQDGVVPNCSRECEHRYRRPFNIRNIQSAPNLGQKTTTENKPLRRACSCIRVERKPDLTFKDSKPASSNNIIRVPKQPVTKKCDPVNLYHYYTALWAKYKDNVPGENDWADLRWHIRQKMAGCLPQQKKHKVPEYQLRDKHEEKIRK